MPEALSFIVEWFSSDSAVMFIKKMITVIQINKNPTMSKDHTYENSSTATGSTDRSQRHDRRKMPHYITRATARR